MNRAPPETTLLSLRHSMPPRPDRRDDSRELSFLRIGCLLFDDRRELCLIRNISAGGALARTYSHVSPGSRVALELKQGESVAGSVRWSEGNLVGIMFDQQVDVIQLLADSSDWPPGRSAACRNPRSGLASAGFGQAGRRISGPFAGRTEDPLE